MPRRVVLMLAGSAAFVLLHAAWIGLRIGGTQVAGFADGIALVVASTVATALTAVRWRRTSERWQRRGRLRFVAPLGPLPAGRVPGGGVLRPTHPPPSSASG